MQADHFVGTGDSPCKRSSLARAFLLLAEASSETRTANPPPFSRKATDYLSYICPDVSHFTSLFSVTHQPGLTPRLARPLPAPPPPPPPPPHGVPPSLMSVHPQPLPLTPEQIAANEADIRSLCEKVGQDPTMLLESMPKSYTAATPTLFS